MERHIRIIHGFRGSKKGAVCFMTLTGQNDSTNFTFEDSIQGTALRLFYERICLGSTFPPEMIINGISTPNHAFAAALFTDPSLVLTQECLSLISSFDLFHKWADVSHAHIPKVHLQIIQEVIKTLEEVGNNKDTLEAQLRRLGNASTIIESYLSFGILSFDMEEEENGEITFLKEEGPLAMYRSETPRWGEFYKHGFLCGIWLSPSSQGLERPVIFRKSSFVSFDLQELGRSLNADEFSIKGKQGVGWLSCKDPNILLYPTVSPTKGETMEGTSLSLEVIWKNTKLIISKKRKK